MNKWERHIEKQCVEDTAEWQSCLSACPQPCCYTSTYILPYRTRTLEQSKYRRMASLMYEAPTGQFAYSIVVRGLEAHNVTH